MVEPTDTSERGLERLICTALTGHPCDPHAAGEARETAPAYRLPAEPSAQAGGAGWIGGDPNDYDREYCVDLAQLAAFLHKTQPDVAEPFDDADAFTDNAETVADDLDAIPEEAEV